MCNLHGFDIVSPYSIPRSVVDCGVFEKLHLLPLNPKYLHEQNWGNIVRVVISKKLAVDEIDEHFKLKLGILCIEIVGTR